MLILYPFLQPIHIHVRNLWKTSLCFWRIKSLGRGFWKKPMNNLFQQTRVWGPFWKELRVLVVVVVRVETVSLEVESSWSWLLVSRSVSSLREVLRCLLVMVVAMFVGVAEKKQEERNWQISKKGHFGKECTWSPFCQSKRLTNEMAELQKKKIELWGWIKKIETLKVKLKMAPNFDGR